MIWYLLVHVGEEIMVPGLVDREQVADIPGMVQFLYHQFTCFNGRSGRKKMKSLVREGFELYDRDVGRRLAELFCISLL
jgi:hypothetical protein